MKKILLSCLFLFSFSVLLHAQQVTKGTKLLNLGIGLGSAYAYSGSTLTLPPVHASLEVGVADKISVGGLLGYTASKWNQTYLDGSKYSWNFSYLVFGARGSYHFLNNNDKADIYAGLMLGYNVASSKFSTNDPDIKDLYNRGLISNVSAGGFALGAHVGGRYMFSEKVGGFAELGYNISWLSLGATFKL
jgi:hypothetical protein